MSRRKYFQSLAHQNVADVHPPQLLHRPFPISTVVVQPLQSAALTWMTDAPSLVSVSPVRVRNCRDRKRDRACACRPRPPTGTPIRSSARRFRQPPSSRWSPVAAVPRFGGCRLRHVFLNEVARADERLAHADKRSLGVAGLPIPISNNPWSCIRVARRAYQLSRGP